MEKVIILMSTYNGERYLCEQIDSLIKQKDVEIQILIRDDGSKDRTLEILNKYQSEYSFISWYDGVNLGPTQSFFDLIKHAPNADFYALCDQDDVWDEDKLITAVQQLHLYDSNKPNLYYSNLRIVDQNLKFYRNSHSKKLYSDNKYSCLVENLCTGCTAVFNKSAKQLVSDHIPSFCTMHDTWLYMTCKMFGNCIYDFTPHISYRQHNDNVVGAGLKKINYKAIKEKVIRPFNRKLQPRKDNADNFYSQYHDIMSEKDCIKVQKVCNYKQGFYDRFSMFFDKDISCSALYRNVLLKLHILWGTV